MTETHPETVAAQPYEAPVELVGTDTTATTNPVAVVDADSPAIAGIPAAEVAE